MMILNASFIVLVMSELLMIAFDTINRNLVLSWEEKVISCGQYHNDDITNIKIGK